MKRIEGNCDICGCPIKPAKDQAQFNRNLGWHKLKKHGMKGAAATPAGRRLNSLKRYYEKLGKPMPDDVRERLENDMKQQQASNIRYGDPTSPLKPRKPGKPKYGEAEFVELEYCPSCNARFFVSFRKGDKPQSCKLSECSSCKSRFFISKLIH